MQKRFRSLSHSETYLPISEHSLESAATAARLNVPPGHLGSTSEAMHRQMTHTAQIKPTKMKQGTSQDLYLAI